MSSELLKKVRAKRNLESAWRVIEENARASKSEHVRSEIETFKEDVSGNLEHLYRSLLRGKFEFEPAKGIAIPKGKPSPGKRGDIRPIVLATVEARIVQRAILNVLTGLPQFAHFVDSPNSFGGMRKSEKRTLSAVPAAIHAVLQAIGDGAHFVVCADISGFFTRISKSTVSALIAENIDDREFMAFFDSAIRVELANLAQLREHANKFPIEDLGVAQGNSLSPFLGNILLHDFDQAMNAGDCGCKRYIDDFIILAPSSAAAAARLRMAKRLLAYHGMELSAGKSHESPINVRQQAFEFLGIELTNGLLRPARKAQERLLANVRAELDKSAKAFDVYRRDGHLERDLSLVATLRRVDGMVHGWGKHYRFCNDEKCFARIDELVDELLTSYFGRYASARERGPQEERRKLLGVQRLSQIERQPFRWPKLLSNVAA
jgi:RNA-directed DNA polymerase